MSWDPRILPRQDGRTAVVTGGSSGIGYFVAEQLASAGARVILAARSSERAQRAVDSILEHVPDADLAVEILDLASLASVRRAAARILDVGGLDVLINNAGVVPMPGYVAPGVQRTTDGVELMVGTNFLGHFALTAALWRGLRSSGRVVGLGSEATRLVRCDPDHLWSEDRLRRPFWRYAQSKHAVQAFAAELHRRIVDAGDDRASLLAHPGYAIGARSMPRPLVDAPAALSERLVGAIGGYLVQGKDQGAWPVVRAAIDPAARSGDYFGPDGVLAGRPRVVRAVRSSARADFGARLWAEAEARSGIGFEI